MNSYPITTQVSAGGVAFRRNNGTVEVALILVGPRQRWQLPKGAINKEEQTAEAARREVREETGLEAVVIDELNTIEYWFYASKAGQRVRFHKFVHFYLMRYQTGDVANHDNEVEEARWFEIDEAIKQLAFESEKEVVRMARERIREETPQEDQHV